MSAQHPIVDPIQLANSASQHQIRCAASQEEMKIARENSQIAGQLVNEVKKLKVIKLKHNKKNYIKKLLMKN
eukprot:UN09852